MNKQNKLTVIIFFFVIIMFTIFILIFTPAKKFFATLVNKEVIIPDIRIPDGGIQLYMTSAEVQYFNPENKRIKSDIRLTNPIKLNQTVKRYMPVSGIVVPVNPGFIKKYFRSVIFEVNYQNHKEFFILPLNKYNRFSGYIYFTHAGICTIYCYLFFDNIAYQGDIKRADSLYPTMASLRFFADVIEAVPLNSIYLLPSRNVDCGNKILRNFTMQLTRGCTTNLEKVRTIYEFIVFGDGMMNKANTKIRYKKYSADYCSPIEFNYYNTFIASQVLTRKEGICNDYAELFAAMARSQGVKVKKIGGFYDQTKQVGHLWNLIDLTGDEKQWLKVDPSWGNQDKKHYRQWAEFYPEFDSNFFENTFSPYTHRSFTYEQNIEY